MKKLYSTPAMEVKAFEVEEIMAVSGQLVYNQDDVTTDTTAVNTVKYDTLFTL